LLVGFRGAMIMLIPIVMAASALLAAVDGPHDNPPPERPVPASKNASDRLREELARLQNGHASDFFAALSEASKPGNSEGITDEVPEFITRVGHNDDTAMRAPALIKQVDDATREVLRFSLARMLAPGSPPPTIERWNELKARIEGHGEAIVLEGVLGLGQAQRWRDRASRPVMPVLPGRYSTIAVDYPDGQLPSKHTRAQYVSFIHQQQYRSRASDLFHVLLAHVHRQIGLPTPRIGIPRVPGLTPEQTKVLLTVDQMGRDASRYWWVRDVERLPSPRNDPNGIRELPPTPVMELRLSDRGLGMRESIVAHADEMALEGVLTPEQAERAKLELWRRRGVHALLDPELAARLGMSEAQRAELAKRLKERLGVYHDLIRSGLVFIRPGQMPQAEADALVKKGRDETERKVASLDQPIWEILRPAQLRALAELLNKPVAGYAPAASNTGPRGPG
jgi:hypothetical protein